LTLTYGVGLTHGPLKKY